jgi:HAD superfamily hydrolase (TIGR01450 family)
MSEPAGSTGATPDDAPDPATTLRERLAGVRGLILDADGVIVWRGGHLPGAPEALARLAELGIPYRIVTNFSSAHRTTLAARFAAGAISPDRLITAASAAAAHTARTHAGRRLLVIGSPDALREFDGQAVAGVAEAAADPGAIAAVVVGDAGDDLRFGDLDVAFRCLRAGADFIAMHRNLWWMTRKGETLDSGALVAGLEVATGRRALVAGKPSGLVFREAVAGIAADLGRRVPARSIAMVGDDPVADVAGARRVGLRGVLVLTGKTSGAAIGRLRAGPVGTRPDAIAPSLTEVVAALD